MKRLLIDADGVIANAIELEANAEYTPPDGLTVAPLTLTDEAIGGSWDGVTYTPPPAPPAPSDPLAELRTQYEAAATDAKKLDVLARHLGLT